LAALSRRIAGTATAEQFPENFQICHHTDAVLVAKHLHVGGGEVPCVSGTQNIRSAIRRSLEDRIVGWIGQGNRLYDGRFHQVSGIRQIARKARRFASRDPVPHLNPGIEQYTFDLVENEPG
jgi:hypothetical protein